MKRAAIFDMDGLLIDSEPLWRRAEVAVFGALGVPLTEAMCETTTGMRIDDVVAHWYARYPWPGADLGRIADAVMAAVTELIRTEGQALPGVHDTITAFRRAGWCLGLASSSARSLIDAVLQRLELDEAFEVCCSAMDEDRGKPDPAVYLSAAARLEVAPPLCVAFEDSPAGVLSALAAGMRVVAVPAMGQRGNAEIQRAHRVVGSLAGFSLAGL
ncbi:MAG: hexitol phosphatase HxpB [Gammaproteobacteria bacterium]|jgi:sugar-phosphatase|nr:hexitol phosphatase HxpB [Gammaproteobacteria bacterium]